MPPSRSKNSSAPFQTTTFIHDARSSSSSSGPMSVPRATRQEPPPPLPPPRRIDDVTTRGGRAESSWFDASHGEGERSQARPGPSAIRFGSSLHGGQHRPPAKLYTGPQRNVDFGRKSPLSPSDSRSDTYDGIRVPDITALLEYNDLKGEKHLGQKNLERSAHAYDQSVLSRIGGPHGSPRSASSFQPTFSGEPLSSPREHTKQLPSHSLRPLSMPERRHSGLSQPKWSASSLASPGLSALQSPVSDYGFDRTHSRRSDSISNYRGPGVSTPLHRRSVDQTEDTGMNDLNLQDRSPSHSESGQKAGQKRRAQSPPGESTTDPSLRGSNGAEAWQRYPQAAKMQQQQQQQQPQPQAPQQPPQDSYSSMGSGPQNHSYASSYQLSNASTATSYSSEHQPGAFPDKNGQQGAIYNQGHVEYMLPPQAGSNRAPPIPHRRTTSSGMPRPPGLWICDCCPKKPKKFENEEELRMHEMEKQYVCQYCNNRFKNKNEAERHQNSLHLRRHSWSCAALTSFEDAFHPTMNNALALRNSPYPAPATDTCGYCGQEFANPADWEARIEHLNRIHKFGECNQGKKFFRADHFRQHLKHSHAGTSGKWTNMLENACMKDEPPPQPIHQMTSPGMMSLAQEAGQMPAMASPAIMKRDDVVMQPGIGERQEEMMREA